MTGAAEIGAGCAEENFVSTMLPIAAVLDGDTWRVFLAVCEEDGISVQKLRRVTGFGQSTVIRATSILESWCPENHRSGDLDVGLLHTLTETERGFRRKAYLTAVGEQLRERLRDILGGDDYPKRALDFHGYLQEVLENSAKLAA